ncbi:MAG TPA: hypothetical protein VIJ60_06605 [Acidimicrobiales bacterium]
MKRYTGPLLAALLPIVGVGALAVAPASASAATSTSTSSATPNWSSLEQTALDVTASARGDGTLDVAGLPSPVAQSTITTASGPVSLAQQTVVATDRSGVVVLDVALLGGRQLVVNEMSPGNGDQGETLVLAPGTSTVTGTYRLAGASQATAQTAALRTASHRHGTGIVASDGVLHRGGHHVATLATAGGCFPAPQEPGVISSIYGPLIQGTGVIDCTSSAETLSMVIGLYMGSTQLSNAGAASYGSYLAVNSYSPCYSSSGHWFQTAQLWSVNGTLQSGADSGWSALSCT